MLGTGEVPEIVGALNGIAADRRRRVTLFARSSRDGDVRTPARSPELRRCERSHRDRTLPTYLYDATTPRLLTTPGTTRT